MSVQEARRQFIEDSFGQAEAFLRDEPLVADALGPLALELADVCQRLYIPEIQDQTAVQDQTLVIPESMLESEALPVVALPSGEKVYVPAGLWGMTAEQRRTAITRAQELQSIYITAETS